MQLIEFEGLTESENKRVAKLLKYQCGYMKLWSDDTGRSLTGAWKGTLIGIFPKLTITIPEQYNNDRSLILRVFNSDLKKVKYYDTEKKQFIEKTFYFGDVIDEVHHAVGDNQNNIKHKALDVEIVATTRR